ncbi:MAG: PilZ domain-containing protein [Nitrospirota bacterium]
MKEKKSKKKSLSDIRKWYRYQFFGNATVTVPKEDIIVNANVANISFSGVGLYSPSPIGRGKWVKIKLSFVDKSGKVKTDVATGKVDWQTKFKNNYLIGIIFDDELTMHKQPRLLKHLLWLINTYNWPQPYKDKRIAVL